MARPSLGARPAVELGDVQQQVTPGDPATTAEAAAAAHLRLLVEPRRAAEVDAMDRVEATGEDEPLGDGSRHPGPLPEVGQARVGLTGDDLRDLGVADAVDVGEGEPDRLTTRRRCARTGRCRSRR